MIRQLGNYGNTCYLNCALQCLLNDKLFINRCQKELRGRECELVSLIQQLKGTLYSPSGDAMVINKIMSILNKKNSEYVFGMQHDTDEVLIIMIDIIHEQLKTKYIDVDVKMNFIDREAYKAKIKHYDVLGYSFISDMYMGQFMNIIRCSCGHTSCSFDMYNRIVIEGNSENIITGIYNYCNVETITDYECDGCHERTTAVKKSGIYDFPKRLIIVINRYSMRKAPINIDTNIIIEMKNKKWEYTLGVIVQHFGIVNGGHYVTDIVRNENEVIRIDDMSGISVIPINNVLRSYSAYMLIYNLTVSPFA